MDKRRSISLVLGLTVGCGATADTPTPVLDAGATELTRDAGTRDAGTRDAGPRDGGHTGPVCPPAGPFGTAVGDTIPNATFRDCDGNFHTLHDLCETRAAWMFVYAGW